MNRETYWRGFLYAFFSRFLGSMLNVGVAFGSSMQEAARQHAASPTPMSNAVWLPCLYAGFIPGVVYCWYLMNKRHSLDALGARGTWSYWNP
jgi:membrane protease YdiL (CAAX protease family)